jgi:hypothetical protein
VEAIMPNQTGMPGPDDVADERGKFTPSESPQEPTIAPDSGIDEAAIDRSSGDAAPTPRTGDEGPAIEGLADPDADANFPEPSKPISMR